MFITLHALTGFPVDVNPQQIARMEPQSGGYVVHQPGVPSVTVKQTPELVAILVREAAHREALEAAKMVQELAQELTDGTD